VATTHLTAFWIQSPFPHGPLGFGITAWSLDDALAILRAFDYGRYLPEYLAGVRVTEGVTVAELDQLHVVANMGPIRCAPSLGNGGQRVLRGPFLILAILLVTGTVCPILLPGSNLLSYLALLGIALWFAGRWWAGHLKNPAAMAAVGACYLGLTVLLHGIVLCWDTPMGGVPPTDEEQQSGTGLAYLGGAVAAVTAVVAYGMRFHAGVEPGESEK
jgi:hypothetical protein